MAQQRQEHATQQPASSATATVSRSLGEQTRAPRILRLRGRHSSGARSVQWAEDVVDNEHLKRKKSKVCCIYHRPKATDESSEESSSSSSDCSSSDSDADKDKPSAKNKASGGDRCDGNGSGQHSHGRNGRRGERREKREKRTPSPNAYERQPRPKRPQNAGEAQGNQSMPEASNQ